MDPVVAFATFLVIFPAELPDKSAIATLVLGHRYPGRWVWLGVAAAFAVHVTIAVIAGKAFSLLPDRFVEAVVAVLFGVGAAVMLFGPATDPVAEEQEVDERDDAAMRARRRTWAVSATAFTVVFIGEWGDLTQIATANLAAKYDDAISVWIGAVAALWMVAALAVIVGDKLLTRLPVMLVRRISGVVLALLAVATAIGAVRG